MSKKLVIFHALLSILIFTTSLAFERSIAQDISRTEATRTNEASTKQQDTHKSEISIPKGEEALRQLQLDNNRQIDALEISIKQAEAAMSLMEEWQNELGRKKYDPNSKFLTLENSNKSKNIAQVQSIIQQIYFEFFNTNSITFRTNEAQLTPGTIGRKSMNGLQQQIIEISSTYQQRAQEGLPEGFFTFLAFSPSSSSSQTPKTSFTDTEIQKIKNFFSQQNKTTFDSEIKSKILAASNEISQEITKQKAELQRLAEIRRRINEATDKAKKEINELAITLGLPLFCTTIVVLFVVPFLAQHFSKQNNSAGQMPGSFQFSTLVEIATVLLLTMSILILGLGSH